MIIVIMLIIAMMMIVIKIMLNMMKNDNDGIDNDHGADGGDILHCDDKDERNCVESTMITMGGK